MQVVKQHTDTNKGPPPGFFFFFFFLKSPDKKLQSWTKLDEKSEKQLF